ncbi:MAG: hypothetical protein Q7S40_23055 [Opitutaceae bacterium]|nr:hypothetical protein [Opitutaceae bacterium]
MERPAQGVRRYVFLSPGEVHAPPGRPAGGTGLRYVKARFDESFPGGWTLVDGPAADGWQTVIEIGMRATKTANESARR